jgi:hypothetical protein
MLIRTDLSTEDEMDFLVPPKKRRAAPSLRRLVPTEAMLQRSIIQGFQLYGIYAVHVPNEGKRSDWERMQGKRDGIAAGFPDLALYKKPGLHGLMELKRPGWKPPKSGAKLKAWEHRVEYHDRLRSFGIPVESCVTSWDEAMAAVRAWGWVQ